MSQKVNDPRSGSHWLAALAGSNRLAILRALAAGDLNVTEIARAIGSEHPNVSHHLIVLRRAGVVVMRERGRFNEYGLNAATVTVTATHMTLTHESGLTVTVPLR